MRAWRRIERAPEIGASVFNSSAGHVNVSEMSDETKTTSPPTALDATQVRTMLPDPRRLSSNALGSVPEAQRYHERGLLGQGGMGEIMLVEDAAIGRDFLDGTHTLVHVPSVKQRKPRRLERLPWLEHAIAAAEKGDVTSTASSC